MSGAFTMALESFRTLTAQFGRDLTYTPRGESSRTVKGFVRGLRPAELIGGFEQTDLVLTVAAEGVPGTPAKFDRWTITGRPYAVVYANPLMAGETVMGYKVIVRGGG